MSNKPLKDKIAFITGASRGLGAETALALSNQGAHVIIAARTIGGLERTHDEIEASGGTATIMPLDLKKETNLDHLGPTILERFGRLDILVGNAGILGDSRPVGHYSPKVWADTFQVNVHANQLLIRTLDPLLRQSDAGRAVFVTSGTAHICDPYFSVYSASKAALDAMVLTYAKEVTQTNLKVNLIRPGIIDTKLLQEAYPGGYPDKQDLTDIKDAAEEVVKLCLPSCVHHNQVISPFL